MEWLKLYTEENRNILFSMSWLNKNSNFDKSIGDFTDIDLLTFLENINSFDYEKDIFYDDMYYILEYTKISILHLIKNINKEVKREHRIVPVSQAKEFDSKTALWVSRQDGFTIKDKLKHNKIKTVKRYRNVDTYENRIFKIFLKKLILVEEKRKQIQSNKDLIGKIRRWLRSDDAKSINEYGNIVYNNILLHHPHYSKIFKSYKWLNRLDEKVEFYSTSYIQQIKMIIKFQLLTELQFFTTEAKILPNTLNKNSLNNFDVNINNSLLNIDLENYISQIQDDYIQEKFSFKSIKNAAKYIINNQIKIKNSEDRTFNTDVKQVDKVFTDLFRLFPIAKIDKQITNFPIILLQDIDGAIVNANNTKVINLHYGVDKIYTLPEILKTYNTDILRKFLENFEKYFGKNQQLHYIIPDYVNIFEFSSVKKTINSYFPNSRNIPKSILAGLQYLFNGNLQENDTLIYIQKNHDNDLYVTPLLVKYDESLQSITNGLYLEKHPTRKLKEESDIISELNRYFNDSNLSKKLLNKFLQNGIKGIKKEHIAFYHNKNLVYLKNTKNLSKPKNRIKQIKSLFTNKNLFKNDFIEIKDTNEDNLNNFEKLLQYEKNNYKLWKEHLPRLAMGNIPMNGYFGEFVLVDDNSKVIEDIIEIKNHFSIPANTKELSFPLIFGEENINFEAYITSNQLPFKEDVECALELRYNYEDETPYKLTFIPLDKKYKPLNIKWREIQQKECNNLPIPSYPPKRSWEELDSNLLNNILKNFNFIIKLYEISLDLNRESIILSDEWEYDTNNKEYQEIDTSVGNIRVYRNFFIDSNNKISFKLIKRGKFYRATEIFSEKEYLIFKKYFKFNILTAWNQGNSLSNTDVPNSFRLKALKAIQSAVKLLEIKDIDDNIKYELEFFLSSLHQDTPEKMISKLLKYSESLTKQNLLAYSIGNMNLQWQKNIVNNIFDSIREKRKVSDALKIFGIISWRYNQFILLLSYSDYRLLLTELYESLKQDMNNLRYYNEYKEREEINHIVLRKLELLLALLRYRAIEKDILCYQDKLTQDFLLILNLIIKNIIDKKLYFDSRIQLDIDIPDTFKNTPDLLYALRMYLSGNTEATQSIKVLGVSDD